MRFVKLLPFRASEDSGIIASLGTVREERAHDLTRTRIAFFSQETLPDTSYTPCKFACMLNIARVVGRAHVLRDLAGPPRRKQVQTLVE